MNRFPFLILGLCVSFLLCQCKTKDTCNAVLGDTFQSIVQDSLFRDAQNDLSLRFSWNALDVLPNGYFADAALIRAAKDRFGNDWVNDHEDLVRWQADSTSFLLVLKASALPVLNADETYSFHHRFPDRADHIDCTHPGSGDAYYLDLSFSLRQVAADEFEFSQLRWQESFQAGGF
ncbi:MAG: hypothetical protein AAFV95_24820 [Bacteroidota bacterium]